MQLNLSLTILEDLLLECDEAFKLVLVYTEGQEGVSVRPGGGTATITIVDDDGEYSNTIEILNPQRCCIPEVVQYAGESVEVFVTLHCRM